MILLLYYNIVLEGDMAETRADINRKLLQVAFVNERKEDVERYISEALAKDDVLTIDYESDLVLEDEKGDVKEFRQEEKITCYPLGDWTMYETTRVVVEKGMKNCERWHDLILLTPEGNKYNCDFFDAETIKELKYSNSNYKNMIRMMIESKLKNNDDVDAVMRFVDLIENKQEQ